MSSTIHTKAMHATMSAQRLTIKALQHEISANRHDNECVGRLFAYTIEQLKLENEQLKRYIFENGAKL